MNVEITIQVPEALARVLGYSAQDLPDRALEALVVNECARGRISRGKVAEILGLSFHEAEELFKNRQVPYPAKTAAEDGLANSSVHDRLK